MSRNKLSRSNDKVLRVSPAELIHWLTKKERKSRVLMLGLDPEISGGNDRRRFQLNVVFNALKVRSKFYQGGLANIYIGTGGADIEVIATGGTVVEHTGEKTLNVEYTRSTEREGIGSGSISPGIKAKLGGAGAELQAGQLTFRTGTKEVRKTKFKGVERPLACAFTGDSIEWKISEPKADKVVRDYRFGNVWLFATCHWEAGCPKAGEILIQPTDVSLFRHDGTRFSIFKSAVLRFVLRRKIASLHGVYGETFRFVSD